ncbi:TRAM domain-containing protein [Patescibacteria group bacterium]|nr:TRAM domain-containing protein [Patescibacteria group bacterium]
MNVQAIARLVIGIVFGTAGYYLATVFVNPPEEGVRQGVRIILAIFAGGLSMYLVPLITKWVGYWSSLFSKRVANEIISQLRLPRIPNPVRIGIDRESKKWVNPMVMDTSALIDGRIADIVESGFLYGTLIVPDIVLSEMRHIADSSEGLKRGKGRRGFDVLERIKKSKGIKTIIYDTGQNSLKNVDDRLLKMAKMWRAKMITTDFNLNKLATVSGVKILNVNELSNSIKVPLIPGEELNVKVIQEGKEKNQGIAYLPDGTMIVVEEGDKYLGKNVSVRVSRSLQTAAGRMIFAKLFKI